MSGSDQRKSRKGAVHLAELVAPVIGPVAAKRGFAAADLIATWPAIVGAAYSDITAPERIAWPRPENETEPGVLHLRVDGPRAIFIQHELPQIIERVNAFFGYRAIGAIRLLQGPVKRRAPAPPPQDSLSPESEVELAGCLANIDDDRLKSALDRLGRAVLARRD
jgi:hypothetical protein